MKIIQPKDLSNMNNQQLKSQDIDKLDVATKDITKVLNNNPNYATVSNSFQNAANTAENQLINAKNKASLDTAKSLKDIQNQSEYFNFINSDNATNSSSIQLNNLVDNSLNKVAKDTITKKFDLEDSISNYGEIVGNVIQSPQFASIFHDFLTDRNIDSTDWISGENYITKMKDNGSLDLYLDPVESQNFKFDRDTEWMQTVMPSYIRKQFKHEEFLDTHNGVQNFFYTVGNAFGNFIGSFVGDIFDYAAISYQGILIAGKTILGFDTRKNVDKINKIQNRINRSFGFFGTLNHIDEDQNGWRQSTDEEYLKQYDNESLDFPSLESYDQNVSTVDNYSDVVVQSKSKINSKLSSTIKNNIKNNPNLQEIDTKKIDENLKQVYQSDFYNNKIDTYLSNNLNEQQSNIEYENNDLYTPSSSNFNDLKTLSGESFDYSISASLSRLSGSENAKKNYEKYSKKSNTSSSNIEFLNIF